MYLAVASGVVRADKDWKPLLLARVGLTLESTFTALAVGLKRHGVEASGVEHPSVGVVGWLQIRLGTGGANAMREAATPLMAPEVEDHAAYEANRLDRGAV